MEQVLELPIRGRFDEARATEAAFVGWNLAGSRPPLVLIRTWADEIPRQQRLAWALGPDRPLYSMGHPTGHRPENYPERVAQWADFCLERYEKLALAGPARIGGWSFGGVVALEVARRLAARGQQIELVAMLDSRVPEKKPTRETRRFMKLGTTLQEYALLHSRDERSAYLRALARHRLARTAAKLRSLPGKLRRRRRPLAEHETRLKGRVRPMDRLTRAIRVCYLKYTPDPIDLPIVQLWTEESREKVAGDVSLGWSRTLEGEVRIAGIPGSHFTMFEDEHVHEVARHLERALEGLPLREPAQPTQAASDRP